MTLTDAGPLIALIDSGEPDHAACKEALDGLALPLITTWPAFTEAMYLLGSIGGWRGQQALWRWWADGNLTIADTSPTSTGRAAELMEHYSDRPMDLADATLVALGEELQLSRIFTLDSDFHIYRRVGGTAFELVPG